MSADSTLTRRVLLTALGASSATGCFASFGATTWLYSWNDSFDSKWIKWLIFLLLAIIPVYFLFVVADVLVINSIEFWTGEKVITVSENSDGTKVTRRLTEEENLVALDFHKDGKLERTLYARRLDEGGLTLLDENGKVLTQVRTTVRGSLQLVDGNGKLLLELEPEQAGVIANSTQDGKSLARAIENSFDVSALAPGQQSVGYL